MILSVTNAQASKSTTTISNSYNTYTYNTNNNYPAPIYNQKIDYTLKRYPTKDYNYLRYISIGNHEKYSGFFGNEINEYKVYVKNREYNGGYFTVKFYLTDYYGKTRTESMTYYLKPHEEKKFVYRNVYSDGKEYKYWKYKIVSHTRI